MAFTPRQFSQILQDMINYVRTNTVITDFQIASAIRTVLEAAAIEDDSAYFAMTQLLDAFSLFSATGTDLVARVAEDDVSPLPPSSAVGELTIYNGGLATSLLAFDVLTATTTIIVEDSSVFGTSGFPYNIRLGEGTLAVEDAVVSGNNTTTNTLTVAPLTNDHNIGDRVSFVSGSADLPLSAGIQAQVPATGSASALVYVTTSIGTLVNGNYASTPIRAQAIIPGPASNVSIGRVTQFTASAPFSKATVSNTKAFGSGRDVESDEELRSRALLKKQSASRGTTLALKEAVLAVTDPVTKQRVASANVLEQFSTDEVIVYIDDGTGFVPDQVQLAITALDGAVSPSDPTIAVLNASDYPENGYIIVSPENGSQIELLRYVSINRTLSPAVLTLATSTANAHDDGDEVVLVDVLTLASDAAANFFKTYDLPVVRGSDRLWLNAGGGLELQIRDTDYIIKRGLGRIELLGDGAPENSVLVASYAYYTGLVSTCQRIINGIESDEINFPGVYTAGMPPVVETPTTRRITVRLAITAVEGKDEVDIAPLVQSVVESYISSLGIGKDVILAEITKRAMRVPGMYNVVIQAPLSDVTVSEDELPVPFAASGSSLVSVS